jgi:SAM-dependent methyltransferase
MELSAAIDLIQNGYLQDKAPSYWIDLGCGNGLFTKALGSLLSPGSIVYAVDKNPQALGLLPQTVGNIQVQKIATDFVYETLHLPPMDGILMANSLHYVSDRLSFLSKARHWLKEDGCFLLVEYDTDLANPWIPYPIPYDSLGRLFSPLGYRTIKKLAELPSVYNRAPIYAALLSIK